MTTDTKDLSDLDVNPSELAVSQEVADLLFLDAHSVNTFADNSVPDEQIRAVYDVLRWGPTAAQRRSCAWALSSRSRCGRRR